MASPHLILLWLSKVCAGIPVPCRRSARVPRCWREGRGLLLLQVMEKWLRSTGNGGRGQSRTLSSINWLAQRYTRSRQPRGGSASPDPPFQPSSPRPRWALAACCPRHEPPVGVWQREYGVFQAPGPMSAFQQPAAYLFIRLLLPVPPAWQGSGELGAGGWRQEQSLLPSCCSFCLCSCRASKHCSSSWSLNGFLP